MPDASEELAVEAAEDFVPPDQIATKRGTDQLEIQMAELETGLTWHLLSGVGNLD